MWGRLNMSHSNFSFHAETFWKHLVTFYAYLWLPTMPYDCTNISSLRRASLKWLSLCGWFIVETSIYKQSDHFGNNVHMYNKWYSRWKTDYYNELKYKQRYFANVAIVEYCYIWKTPLFAFPFITLICFLAIQNTHNF